MREQRDRWYGFRYAHATDRKTSTRSAYGQELTNLDSRIHDLLSERLSKLRRRPAGCGRGYNGSWASVASPVDGPAFLRRAWYFNSSFQSRIQSLRKAGSQLLPEFMKTSRRFAASPLDSLCLCLRLPGQKGVRTHFRSKFPIASRLPRPGSEMGPDTFLPEVEWRFKHDASRRNEKALTGVAQGKRLLSLPSPGAASLAPEILLPGLLPRPKQRTGSSAQDISFREVVNNRGGRVAG